MPGVKTTKTMYREVLEGIGKEEEDRYKSALRNRVLNVREAKETLKRHERALEELKKMSLEEYIEATVTVDPNGDHAHGGGMLRRSH